MISRIGIVLLLVVVVGVAFVVFVVLCLLLGGLLLGGRRRMMVLTKGRTTALEDELTLSLKGDLLAIRKDDFLFKHLCSKDLKHPPAFIESLFIHCLLCNPLRRLWIIELLEKDLICTHNLVSSLFFIQ